MVLNNKHSYFRLPITHLENSGDWKTPSERAGYAGFKFNLPPEPEWTGYVSSQTVPWHSLYFNHPRMQTD